MSDDGDDGLNVSVRIPVRRRGFEEQGGGSGDPNAPVGPINYCTVDDDGNFAGFVLYYDGTPVTAFSETCIQFQEDVIEEGHGHGKYREMEWYAIFPQAWSIVQRDTSGNIDVDVTQTFTHNNTQVGPVIPLGNFLRLCSVKGDVPAVNYQVDNTKTKPYPLPNLISILNQCEGGYLTLSYRRGDNCS